MGTKTHECQILSKYLKIITTWRPWHRWNVKVTHTGVAILLIPALHGEEWSESHPGRFIPSQRGLSRTEATYKAEIIIWTQTDKGNQSVNAVKSMKATNLMWIITTEIPARLAEKLKQTNGNADKKERCITYKKKIRITHREEVGKQIDAWTLS
jgi:hypothetical protein